MNSVSDLDAVYRHLEKHVFEAFIWSSDTQVPVGRVSANTTVEEKLNDFGLDNKTLTGK